MAKSEDGLQTMAQHLNIIATKYKYLVPNKINGNVGEQHTEGKNCDKQK